jgi:hypothetical protein
MLKTMRRFLSILAKTFLFLFLTVVVIYLFLALAALISGILQYRRNKDEQEKRLTWLREDYYQSYESGGEQRFTSFDLSHADQIRLNEVSFLATHNSYQPCAGWAYRMLIKAVSMIPGVSVDGRLADFEMDGLTEQLEYGIRSMELDVEAFEKDGILSFFVTHFLLDNRSTCQDLAKALEELKLWSDHNPGHLPLIILIEPKDIRFPVGKCKTFDVNCALELDNVIREVMGERLMTPDEVLGTYDSFSSMRENDSWPLLEDCLGRVLFVLHPCEVTDAYIGLDRTIRTQVMFPCLRHNGIREEYASFILDNNPASAADHFKEDYEKLRLMVRTRADDYPDFSDARYASADQCGAQIITTDFPPRDVRRDDHTYSFGGYTVKRRNPE